MPCPEIDPKVRGEKMKAKMAALFAVGNAKAAFIHRLAQCTHASECGRLCARLIKAPGVGLVHCWTNYPDSPAGMVHLYEVLENPDFQCPAGLF